MKRFTRLCSKFMLGVVRQTRRWGGWREASRGVWGYFIWLREVSWRGTFRLGLGAWRWSSTCGTSRGELVGWKWMLLRSVAGVERWILSVIWLSSLAPRTRCWFDLAALLEELRSSIDGRCQHLAGLPAWVNHVYIVGALRWEGQIDKDVSFEKKTLQRDGTRLGLEILKAIIITTSILVFEEYLMSLGTSRCY